MSKRRKFSAEFKAKVALEALCPGDDQPDLWRVADGKISEKSRAGHHPLVRYGIIFLVSPHGDTIFHEMNPPIGSRP